jgi:D-alanyl-D-alanine endopeptidase (penicillin-binding protein 7)
MQAVIGGQRVVMVLLDSVGTYSRLGDAQRIRLWLQARKLVRNASLALNDTEPAR